MKPELLAPSDTFARRHIAPGDTEVKDMLAALGYTSLDALADATVPAAIRLKQPLQLSEPLGEHELIEELKNLAADNTVMRSFIGQGYYDTITPAVVLRNVLENPGWYTQYTPYQAEISQGRLEALVNYQTMVEELTGLPMANASLLDEATAGAEAMVMCYEAHAHARKIFWVDAATHPQTIAVIRTRGEPLGIDVKVAEPASFAGQDACGALISYPTTDGRVVDHRALVTALHGVGCHVVMATDLLACTLIAPPGELGADIAIGSAQRFGVPMGFGGPHAAFMSCKDEFRRQIPGRIIGVSKDAKGRVAYRLALQTREQHIRREKATSNICTAQVLLAVMASMYAVYHGPEGLAQIARRTRGFTAVIRAGLVKLGVVVRSGEFFDTLRVDLDAHRAAQVLARGIDLGVNLRRYDDGVGISCDETTSHADVHAVLEAFVPGTGELPFGVAELIAETPMPELPAALTRTSKYLTHPTFNRYHAEHEMLRYLTRLQAKDLSLTTSMIPLGSCTMKLNATTEMIPVTWPEFGRIHPFAPAEQWGGYKAMFTQLEAWLAEITGFHSISLQPNSGAQGEYAGLLAIRGYFAAAGQKRNICLIPQSAHGTNPASAVLAGMQVVVVASNPDGTIDLKDLKAKAEKYKDVLAAVMVTYPSTHGVFEDGIGEVCSIVHANGGQVYMDGANMNAQVGLTSPGVIGADVCHLNLHKTFCLSAGTQVTLPSGVTRPIEHLLSASSVYGWSEAESGVKSARLAAMIRTGKKKCVQITLQDGRTITLTPDHRVLTTTGWVEAKDLKSGNHRIVMGPEMPADDCDADTAAEQRFHARYAELVLSMDTSLARNATLAFFRLVGLVCSDGTFSASFERGHLRRRIRLYLGTRLDAERVVEDIALLAGMRPQIGKSSSVFVVTVPEVLVRAIAEVPGMGDPGKKVISDRTIPDVIVDETTPRAVVREFLGALFGGDGVAPTILHLVKAPPTLKTVRLSQTHAAREMLAVSQTQICAALARVGVTATPDRIVRVPTAQIANKAGEPRWSGGVTVIDSLKFVERVGFRYCAHKTARLSAAAAYWRMTQTVNAQRIEVAKRALSRVTSFVDRGPTPVWSRAVDGAYQEVSSEGAVLSPYYASFSGTKRVSKQVLVNAVEGQKSVTPGVRRTNRRVLAAAKGRGGASTGVPSLKDFLVEIGAASWFSKHTPRGSSYKVTYATLQDATVEPTFHLGVIDVRPAGEKVVYDLTVDDLHSFLANGAVVHNCIPHGGGGPGMGPIGVAKHLAPYLPGHPLAANGTQPVGPVSAAPWGSASILPISFAYIAMMGEPGLKKATQVAILNANYIAHRLASHYPVLYTGQNGRVAHELILDCRGFKKTAGIEGEDVAKRLMDYSFHAPTMSFPVPGTLMIEPTESESKAELDRFCDAMISIRAEIAAIEDGSMDRANNPLKNAPHTAAEIAASEWNHPYTREQAVYPAPWLRVNKYWPPVARVDNAYGDRNLVCTCPPIDAY